MPSLSLIQSAIHDAHFRDEPTAAARFVRADGLSAEQRLGIYRNNTFITLTAALGATYSVVKKLVGEDFFTHTAGAYLHEHPPRPGPLSEYGETFPDFLDDFEPAQSVPYLSGVGRLEWACNVAYHAADATPLKPEELQQIPTLQLPRLRFQLHPSHQFVTSCYPVDRIWMTNQPDAADEVIELGSGAELLIVRPRETVRIHRLDDGVFGFLMALGAGQSVEIACATALAANPDFDLAQAMITLLATGVFVASDFDPLGEHQQESTQCRT